MCISFLNVGSTRPLKFTGCHCNLKDIYWHIQDMFSQSGEKTPFKMTHFECGKSDDHPLPMGGRRHPDSSWGAVRFPRKAQSRKSKATKVLSRHRSTWDVEIDHRDPTVRIGDGRLFRPRTAMTGVILYHSIATGVKTPIGHGDGRRLVNLSSVVKPISWTFQWKMVEIPPIHSSIGDVLLLALAH